MRAATIAGLLLFSAGLACAQDIISARAGAIHSMDGRAVFIDDRRIRPGPEKYPLLKDGQILRTGRAHVEVLLGPAVYLRLAGDSAMQMEDGRLDSAIAVLKNGTALVEAVQLTKNGRIWIRMGECAIEIRHSGLYRFDLPANEIRVYGGELDISEGDRLVKVGRGKAIQLDAASVPAKFQKTRTDDLHEWAARRSFRIFIANAIARREEINWEFQPNGTVYSRTFDRKFFSPLAQREYFMRQAQIGHVPTAENR